MRAPGEGIARRDLAIAAVVSLLGVALMVIGVVDHHANPGEAERNTPILFRGLLPVDLAIPLFLLVTVPLLWRRVAPVAAAVLALAGLAVNELVVGTDVIRCGIVFPTAFLFAFAAGAHLEGRESVEVLAAALAMTLLDGIVELDPVAPVVFGVVTVAMWGIGRVVRSRGRMADELRTRTAELREARDERARLEVATERARLSGELDELLQRRLAELARIADEADPAADPERARATLAEVEGEARRTLEEMRGVLGVLRSDDAAGAASMAPQPTLTQLDALLVRAKGTETRLTVEGSPRVLPPSVELSAYRIVENLLDALDDAADVAVRVRFTDEALELAVSGPARRGARESFERARERARIQHGSLEATIKRGRADAVASIPVASAA